MFRTAAPLVVSADQKRELELLVRNGNCPQKVALGCRLLLLAQQGVANQSIAEQLNVSRPTLLALRAAFAKGWHGRGYRDAKAQTFAQSVDAGVGTEHPRCHAEDTSRRRQYALECSNAGQSHGRVENNRAIASGGRHDVPRRIVWSDSSCRKTSSLRKRCAILWASI